HTSYPSPALYLFTDPAPTELYPLSLHDALPISMLEAQVAAGDDAHQILAVHHRHAGNAVRPGQLQHLGDGGGRRDRDRFLDDAADRKSTRLNSSHVKISYAVFCLKKKKNEEAKL